MNNYIIQSCMAQTQLMRTLITLLWNELYQQSRAATLSSFSKLLYTIKCMGQSFAQRRHAQTHTQTLTSPAETNAAQIHKSKFPFLINLHFLTLRRRRRRHTNRREWRKLSAYNAFQIAFILTRARTLYIRCFYAKSSRIVWLRCVAASINEQKTNIHIIYIIWRLRGNV